MVKSRERGVGRTRTLRWVLRRVMAALVATVLIVGMAPTAAQAAGTLSVDVTILDPNGQPVSVVDARSMEFYTVNVAYSCLSDACTGTQIFVAPTPKDPFYNSYRKETGEPGYVPPGPGGPTPTGTLDTGYTLALGNMTAGSGGSFQLRYNVQQPLPRNGGSFFLNGAPIDPVATMSATGSATVTDTARATWYNEIPAGPTFSLGGATTLAAGSEYTLSLGGLSGCAQWIGTGLYGIPYTTCAASWEAVIQLPAKAVYVAGSGGQYDPVTHTVTLSQSGASAYRGIVGGPNSFRVLFPADAYPTSGPDCVQSETFTGVSHNVTYLDGTTKPSVSPTPTQTVSVGNCEPFGDASGYKDIGGADSTNSTGRVVYIPETGVNAGAFWAIRTVNEANVPATVHVVDDQFDNTSIPVTSIRGVGYGYPVTVNYMLDGETTTRVGTLANSSSVITAPAGQRFVRVEAQTSQLPRSANNTEAGTDGNTFFELRLFFDVASGVDPGSHRNTSRATVEFPGTTLASEVIDGAQTVSWMKAPLNVTFDAATLTTDNGSSIPTIGSTVTWSLNGAMTGLPTGNSIRPQYVFLAPEGWNITGTSWATTNPGAQISAVTNVTYSGKSHQAVVVNWDSVTGTTGSKTLEGLRVATTPTSAATPGNNNQIGYFFLGDANNGTVTTYRPAQATESTDIDGDGATDSFAMRSTAVSLSGTTGIQVLKEICLPDTSQPDGCQWIGNPGTTVPVAPNTTSITYRVTITNPATATLNNLVAYDVLPYPNDFGTSNATASNPRGSTFTEKVSSIVSSGSGMTLQFSNSTNPTRPEVYSSGVDNDWDSTASGAQAIKMTVSSLAPRASTAFVYQASVTGNPAAGSLACNSVAVTATGATVYEPSPVCAQIQSADLAGGDDQTLSAQANRPVSVPFTFTNVGTDTAASVTVDVPAGATVTEFPAGWNCTQPSSAPVNGPSQLVCELATLPDAGTAEMRLRVVPTGGDVQLTATIDGPLYDPDEANNVQVASLDVAPAPAGGIVVSKTDGVAAAVPGQELTYTITVTNPLTLEDLPNVTVTDTLPVGFQFVSATAGGTNQAGVVTWTIPNLPAATGTTVDVTVRVTDAAVNTSTNTVEAQTLDPGFPGETLTGGATDTDAVDRMTFTKVGVVSSTGAARAGDGVQYTFTATNAGGGTLTGVAVSDPMPGLSALTYTWPGAGGVLAPGEQVTATATYTLTQADVDAGTLTNTATATASSGGGGTLSEQATETIPLQAAPSLTFDKSVSATTSRAGETLTYTFVAQNSGNVTLTGVSVTDPMPGLSALSFTWPAAAGVLAPGQSVTATATYVVTQANVDTGSIRNTATATATPPSGPALTRTDSVTVTFTQNPTLLLEKSGSVPDPANVQVGTVVTYTFVVTNTGNTTVSNVAVADPMPGLSAITFGAWPGTPGVLTPGQSVTASATYSVTQQDIDRGGVTNTATATGTSPGGNPSSTDTVTVPLQLDPAIALIKTGQLDQAGTPQAGDTVTFEFTIENTGNTTLNGVVIDDDLEDLSSITYQWPGTPGTLAGGEIATATATYEVTQADIDRGFVLNTATVAGTAPGDDVVSASDSAQVNLAAAPAVTFSKTTQFDGSGSPRTGDDVEYSFTVENTGNVTLTGIEITDALEGVSAVEYGTWPGAAGTLAPGQSVTATANYELTQSDLDAGSLTNNASLSGAGVRGGGVSGADAVTVALAAAPSVALDKAADRAGDEVPRAGEVITYTFTVGNTGNVTVSAVDIVDGMPGLSGIRFSEWPGSEGVLAPEQSVTATATYVLTQDDLDDGAVANDAVVTAAPARGATATDDASVTTELEAVPAATFDKAGELADEERPMAGDELTFTFTVTNTGNVTIDDIAITDDLDGLSPITFGVWPGAEGTLTPGQSVTATATYALTQADVDAGERPNAATAAFAPVRGEAFSVDTATVVDIAQLPSLALVKTADLDEATADGVAQPGDRIDFVFEVTNTGNVTVASISIADPMIAVPDGVATLAPGDTAIMMANPYTVTRSDGDNGRIVNTATALGDAPDGQQVVSAAASVTVLAAPLPDLAVTGADLVWLWPAGATLLIGGAILLLITRRKRHMV